MIEYNPMSEEFQDECKKLGMTGRQLTAKYQKEGKYLEKGHRKPNERYTEKELILILQNHYKKYGKVLTIEELNNNSDYPGWGAYQHHFGTYSNAKKMAGLDLESLIKDGNVDLTNKVSRGRFGEIIIKTSFKQDGTIDLSGGNWNSVFDAICPKGHNYDVKCSCLRIMNKGFNGTGWKHHFGNKEIRKIAYFFLLGFNEDYSDLLHVWMIPIEVLYVDNDKNWISSHRSIGNSIMGLHKMKQYEVTDKCIDIFRNMTKVGKI